MKHQSFELPYHGYTLYSQYWISANPRGAVVLVHGMGEYGGRFATGLVPVLVEAGYAVFATDHFGHGHSSGKRGNCPGYEAVLDSVELTLEQVTKQFPDLPVFLYGHSMGGNAVLGYAMKRKPLIRGVISTSPFLKMAFTPPAWKLTLGKVFSKLLPSLTLPSGLIAEHTSRDPEEVRKYKEDPLIHDRVSPNFVFPFLEMGQWMIDHPHEMEVPSLLCHGTADMITSHEATKNLGMHLENSQTVLFESGYHELQHDYEKEKLYFTVTQWLYQNQ